MLGSTTDYSIDAGYRTSTHIATMWQNDYKTVTVRNTTVVK